MDIKKIEIKQTDNKNEKMLILFNEYNSYGYRLSKQKLYELYISLREEFKDEEN